MTHLVSVVDPMKPAKPRSIDEVMESARTFAAAEDNPLPAMLALQEDIKTEYDLDDAEDAQAFEKAYGERMLFHILQMKEGEELAITCTERSDDWADGPEEDTEDPEEEPGPVLAEEPRRCPLCEGRPDIAHEYGRGYRVQCAGCRITAGAGEWDLQLSKAIARWNGRAVE